MAIGMTWEQYWYGDVRTTKDFLDKDKLHKERANEAAWLQGLYFFSGTSCIMHNLHKKKGEPEAKYPEKPYDIFPKKETAKEREDREEKERLQARLYMSQMMQAGKNWGGNK